jgi:hypothetical protein
MIDIETLRTVATLANEIFADDGSACRPLTLAELVLIRDAACAVDNGELAPKVVYECTPYAVSASVCNGPHWMHRVCTIVGDKYIYGADADGRRGEVRAEYMIGSTKDKASNPLAKYLPDPDDMLSHWLGAWSN